jgi:hypothetical protein
MNNKDLEEGKRYRALSDFNSGPSSTFTAGELVVLDKITFSPYDNATVYLFSAAKDNTIKEWWPSSSDKGSEWAKYFEIA